MNINIDTKFSINDEVYDCQISTKFKEGKFITTYKVNKSPKIVKNIKIIYEDPAQYTVYYILNDNLTYRDNILFKTYEEAQKWCKTYE